MNYRSDRDSKLEIYLNKICVASRYFEIRQLLGQVDSYDLSQSLIASPGNDKSLKIGWQDRVTLHYLVVPIERANSTITFSALSFSRGDNVPTLSQRHGAEVTDFMCRERAHEVFTVSLIGLLLFRLRYILVQLNMTTLHWYLFCLDLVNSAFSSNRERKNASRAR